MLGQVALASGPFARTMADDPRLLIAGAYFAGALLLGAILIALIQRWRRRQEAANELTPEQQLSAYRTLYEQGALSQEEFERLRSLLGREMKPDGPRPEAGPAPKQRPPEPPADGIRPP